LVGASCEDVCWCYNASARTAESSPIHSARTSPMGYRPKASFTILTELNWTRYGLSPVHFSNVNEVLGLQLIDRVKVLHPSRRKIGGVFTSQFIGQYWRIGLQL